MKLRRNVLFPIITLVAALVAGVFSPTAVTHAAIASTSCTVGVYGSVDDLWLSEIQSKLIGTGLFSQVDVQNVMDYTPTLEELQGYQAVLVASDNDFADNVAMGDVLAEYMDAGGGVVMSTFAFYTDAGLGIAGEIVNRDYLPFTLGYQDQGQPLELVPDLPNDPILAGVNSFNGGLSSYHNTVALAAGATQVAHWSNGVPLVATRQPTIGKIAGLNFYPPSSDAREDLWDSTTDGDLLMGNALVWAGNCFQKVANLAYLDVSPRYPLSTGYVNLRWGGSETTGVTYELERSVNGGTFARIYSGSLSAARYRVAMLPRGQHVYRARAIKNGYQPSEWRTASPIVIR
jgi:hypothetical protein